MIVISLGGSLLFNGDKEFNMDYLRQLAPLFTKIHEKEGLAVVVGGGITARKYASTARAFKGSEFESDTLGIRVTRLNARIVALAISSSTSNDSDGENASYAHNFQEATDIIKEDKIPVMGGLLEGITTDACAMLLAEKHKAKALVNLSAIDYLYSGDPKKDKSAKKLETITHVELTALAAQNDARMASTNFPFDLVACKLAQRSNIQINFVDGHNLKEAENALNGKMFKGTLVKD